MDFDKELDGIIFKYNLDKYYPRYRKMQIAKELVKKLPSEWDENERIACIATTRSGVLPDIDIQQFKKLIPLDIPTKIEYFLCKKINGAQSYDKVYDCSCLEQVDIKQFNRVYIISGIGESFVGHWLRKRNIHYISLYDYFTLHGLYITAYPETEYYDFLVDRSERYFCPRNGLNPISMEVFEIQRKEAICEDTGSRDIFLQKLFFLSIVLRNFVLAKKYIASLQHINNCIAAWGEIQLLIQHIHEIIQNRREKDILMFWIDNIPYDRRLDTPFIKDKIKQGIYFDNIMNVTPWTNPSFRTLFCNKKAVDDKSYNIEKIDEGNSIILRSLNENGYDSRIIVGAADWKELASAYRNKNYCYGFSPSSQRIWEMIVGLANSKHKIFTLVHIFQETHIPTLHTKMDDKTICEPEGKRAYLGQLEVDEQLRFYTDFLGQNAIQIYMTDHGREWYWPRHHVFMSICGKQYKPRQVNCLCTYLDFYKIIDQILTSDTIEDDMISRDFVEIQDLDFYNGGMIAGAMRRKGVFPKWPIGFGHRGVVTQKYVYMRFNNGHEWLAEREKFQLPPAWYPRESDICDESLLLKFRAMIHVDKEQAHDEKLKYFRYLKRVYDRAISRNIKKIEIINDLISVLGIGRVAIRTGGVHTQQLLEALRREERKRIACIVDNDPNCVCGNMGLPIVALTEMDWDSVDAVLLSSKRLLPEIKAEARTYPSNVKVIDIYEEFEKQGLHFNYDFYYLEPKPEEWDVGFPFDEV